MRDARTISASRAQPRCGFARTSTAVVGAGLFLRKILADQNRIGPPMLPWNDSA
ncbi:hypothetical protein [Shinella sumterensis]|jgi:hypothetical protein|uniref:Uncharacterized protein n=1 Tax=Shinella sumterensis TaxID=1967501 RepID=A0AA50CSR8_9HYPH|nr:hypothetical protein [Shinella sumterensis]WLS01396.1 hypothetical protein Q9313_28780 [Shinella sumterensis]